MTVIALNRNGTAQIEQIHFPLTNWVLSIKLGEFLQDGNIAINVCCASWPLLQG